MRKKDKSSTPIEVTEKNVEVVKKMRFEHAKKLGVKMIPVNLVIRRQAHDVKNSDIASAFRDFMGDLSGSAVLFQYTVDDACYYEAFYAAGDNQMSPVTIVNGWFYFKD